MSKKFKINDPVIVKTTGERGVVKSREVLPAGKENYTRIEYVVKLGEGIENWKSFTRSELQSIPRVQKVDRGTVKVYDMGDGYKLTLVGKTQVFKDVIYESETDDYFNIRLKKFRIGHSIYNPIDEYDEKMGYKIANNRLKRNPFCNMASDFTGEFDAQTIEAIMDAKAKYIIANKERFIKYDN